ncbi:MAG: hypothetical protein AAF310_02695 [Myxococcota bacterium]
MATIVVGIGFVLAAVYAVICNRQLHELRQQLQHSDKPVTQVPAVSHQPPAKAAAEKPRQAQPASDDAAKKRLQQQVQALTQQLQTLQQKDDKQQEHLIREQKTRIGELSKQLEKATQQQKQWQEQQKELPVDLQQLPQQVLPELARVYRKAQQNEQLIALTRSKLHMAEEKYNELQKRYFAVCRDLAVYSKKPQEPAATGAEESNQTEHKHQSSDSKSASLETSEAQQQQISQEATQSPAKQQQKDDNVSKEKAQTAAALPASHTDGQSVAKAEKHNGDATKKEAQAAQQKQASDVDKKSPDKDQAQKQEDDTATQSASSVVHEK